MKYTKEQISSLSYDRHIGLTANAGSGKTTVLQKRYLNILENGLEKPDPRRIVAITFTKKAASEILAKISSGIEEKMREGSYEDRLKFAEIRDKLLNAQISTIHSFCSKILREFPIESGINPNFAEISEADQKKMNAEAIDRVMEDWLTKSPDKKKKLLDWVAAEGSYTIRTMLELFIEKREKYRVHRKVYERSNEELIEDLRKKTFVMIAPLVSELFVLFHEILKFDYSLLKPEVIRTMSLVNKFVVDFEEYFLGEDYSKFTGPAEDILIRIYAVIAEMIEFIVTKSMEKLRANVAKKIDYDAPEVYNKLGSPLKKIAEMREVFLERDESVKLLDFNREFMELVDEVIGEIESQKELLGVVDFADMILKAHDILENEQVAERVREKYDYLMVDEFQDTDQLQYDIIKKLVPAIEGTEVKHKINLFIVGDAKQSIYGFRNADVRVISQAVEDIKRTNREVETKGHLPSKLQTQDGEMDPLDENAKYGDMMLTASFRLLPAVAAFVNKVCGEIMKKTNDFEVDYSDLVCGRSVTELKSFLQEKDELTDEFGAVDYLIEVIEAEDDVKVFEDFEENAEEEAENSNEAKRIVSYIRDCMNGTLGEYNYSDIAVLSRVNRSFRKLIKELQLAGIPYQVGSGTDFWAAQEIMDLVSLFKFLDNPKDEITLASVLKSPMFSLTDTKLYKIASIEKYLPFYEKYLKFADDENNADDFLLQRSRTILDEMMKVKDRLSLPDFIRFTLNKTAWYGVLANTDGFDQKEANIEKLIGMARAFESKGFRGFYDFVRELELIEKHQVAESEEVNESKNNAVNLMSFHKSKGLEFPVVVLYNINSKSGRPESIIFSDDFGFAKKIPDDENPLGENKSTLIYKYTKMKNDLADEAERKRMLYVAMTRAKDRLCLSATVKRDKGGNAKKPLGFLKMVLEGLNWTLDSLIEEGEIPMMCNLNLVEEGVVTPSKFKFVINRYLSNDNGGITTTKQTQNANYKISDKKIETSTRNEQFSASKLHAYEYDQTEYELRYLLGLPASDDKDMTGATAKPDASGEEIIGSMAGTVIHNVLEHIPDWMNSDGEINEDALEETLDKMVKSGERNVAERLRERAKKECTNITKTKLIRELKENLIHAEHEYSLNLPIDIFFMNGIIDVLIKDNEGNLEVWDWKTNKVGNEEQKQHLAANYELQMKIYAFFVSMMKPKQEVIKCRLLFSRLAIENAQDDAWTHLYEWNKEEVAEFGEEIKRLAKSTTL
jgi:ATP-dependent helicase/nuclease subunit A